MRALAAFLLVIGFAAGASAQSAPVSDSRSEQIASENQKIEELKNWYGMHMKLGGTWPVQPTLKSEMPDERSFLKEFKLKNKDRSYEATGSGNGGDPMAADFVNQARSAISGCGIEKALRIEHPSKFREFNRRFYKVRIRTVAFNLCVDDSSNCDFNSSFAAKNYPELDLILINAFKWNMMMPIDRMKIATHEFFGIIGLEVGTYGYSNNIHLRTVTRTLGPGRATAETFCERY
ncbi:MAG: hypothetical protein EOP06_05615 [Proteobacteria bacterium]|nr:MAG: hypothetical protein EOP06_05615 [Pseudomonadota bacterium]